MRNEYHPANSLCTLCHHTVSHLCLPFLFFFFFSIQHTSSYFAQVILWRMFHNNRKVLLFSIFSLCSPSHPVILGFLCLSLSKSSSFSTSSSLNHHYFFHTHLCSLKDGLAVGAKKLIPGIKILGKHLECNKAGSLSLATVFGPLAS